MADDTGAPWNLPFQEAGDAPNGPALGADLAAAVHAALNTIDAKIATINALAHSYSGSTSDETGFTNTAFAAGGTVVGTTFVCPASGVVKVDWSGQLQQNINAQATFLSPEMRTGSTIGSGTLVGTVANSDRAIITGKAVNASAPALINAGNWAIYTGLTPGATYNVRLMHCVDGGSGTIAFRQVLVQPQL